mmetsp:Transcript_33358/g.51148  ORF Transcript_33358/g.51148 Transcript_33358/m.51148 type:complete len:97 (+) Transcript_33358:879-1169(+)
MPDVEGGVFWIDNDTKYEPSVWSFNINGIEVTNRFANFEFDRRFTNTTIGILDMSQPSIQIPYELFESIWSQVSQIDDNFVISNDTTNCSSFEFCS